MTIKQGEVFPVGRIRVPLDQVKAPKKLLLTVAIEGTSYRNSYDLWVYPPKVDTTYARQRHHHRPAWTRRRKSI